MDYCIYLRKSRADAEAELHGEGETLARHERILTEFAARMGLPVRATYREIVSGETIAARPQMQQLLEEVSTGMWTGVIVMDIDRLARGNSIDQGIISQTFLFSDTKIITPAKTYDPRNELDEEYFEFGLFMSRREYKTINRRLQRGRAAAVREGKYVSNRAPYGYERKKLQNDKGFTLRIIPEQAEIIRLIFEWYTDGIVQPDGTRRQLGISLIARELNARGLSSPTGTVWTGSSIRDMLINPTYAGKLRWQFRPEKKVLKNGKIHISTPRCKDYISADGIHEPIISEATFQAAQKKMSLNKRRPVRGDRKTQNPLASLCVCARCGRRMQRRPNNKNPDLLMCAEPTCDNHASYIWRVEKRVISILEQWAQGINLRGVGSTVYLPDTASLKAELRSLEKNKLSLSNQLSKAYDAYETGIYDADTFQMRSRTLKARLLEIEEKIKAVNSTLQKIGDQEKILTEFIPRTKSIVAAYWSIDDMAERNQLLCGIIDHIEYKKDTRGHSHEEDFDITIHPRLPHSSP